MLGFCNCGYTQLYWDLYFSIGFKTLSGVLSFHPVGLLEHFLQGRSGGHILSQLLFGEVLLSPSLLRTVLPETGFSFDNLFSSLCSISPLTAVISELSGKESGNLIEDPFMWWVTSVLWFQDSLVFWKFDYNVSWCGFLYVLIWSLQSSLDVCSLYFIKSGTFSAIISSSIFSSLFSLFPLWLPLYLCWSS